MGKTVLIIAAIAAVYLSVRWIADRSVRVRAARATRSRTRVSSTVKCARCGAHLPPELAMSAGHEYVCNSSCTCGRAPRVSE